MHVSRTATMVGTIFSSCPERYHINFYCPESEIEYKGHRLYACRSVNGHFGTPRPFSVVFFFRKHGHGRVVTIVNGLDPLMEIRTSSSEEKRPRVSVLYTCRGTLKNLFVSLCDGRSDVLHYVSTKLERQQVD